MDKNELYELEKYLIDRGYYLGSSQSQKKNEINFLLFKIETDSNKEILAAFNFKKKNVDIEELFVKIRRIIKKYETQTDCI